MQDPGFVKRAFAGIASRYVFANHVLSLGIDVLWRRRVAKIVAGRDASYILDLATGSGDLAETLKKFCPGAKVLGADFSVPMMREAQLRDYHALVAADGMQLPFNDSSFEVLTVAFGLRNMACWPDALKEMNRVVAENGALYVLDFSLPVFPIIRQAYLAYLKYVMPRIAGWITGRRDAYLYLCSSIESFPSGKEMETIMLSCGFKSVRSHRLTFGIASLYEAVK